MSDPSAMIQAVATVSGVALALAIPAAAGAFLIARLLGQLEVKSIQASYDSKIGELTKLTRDKEEEIAELRTSRDETHQVNADQSAQALVDYLSARGQSVWMARPMPKPLARANSSMKVITFCNNKGGVAKTTLSGNFGAHLFAKGKRVLFLDMDYQGSLTNLLFTATASPAIELDASAKWLNPSYSPTEFMQDCRSLLYGVNTFDLYPTRYGLATEEERQLVLWLLKNGEADIRLRLFDLLWSHSIEARYDYVIIDAPPRLSVGSINALLASTHFVVPTILDQLATIPIENLLSQYGRLFEFAGMSPKLAGVAAIKTRFKDLTSEEITRANEINAYVRQRGYEARVYEQNIAFAKKYGEIAGVSFAYFEKTLRPSLKLLCEQIEASLT